MCPAGILPLPALKNPDMTLDKLPLQQPAVIRQLADHALTAKLTEMGLYPGKTVTVIFKAPFGDPIAVDLDGYTLSLRSNEAALVEID